MCYCFSSLCMQYHRQGTIFSHWVNECTCVKYLFAQNRKSWNMPVSQLQHKINGRSFSQSIEWSCIRWKKVRKILGVAQFYVLVALPSSAKYLVQCPWGLANFSRSCIITYKVKVKMKKEFASWKANMQNEGWCHHPLWILFIFSCTLFKVATWHFHPRASTGCGEASSTGSLPFTAVTWQARLVDSV